MIDYGDLIIVGYKGGWGGDMFASLLYKNFYPNYQYEFRPLKGQRINNNHIKYDKCGGLEPIKCIRELMLICDGLLKNERQVGQHRVFFEKSKNILEQLLNMVYDDSADEIINNIIEICRYMYKTNPPKIWSCHYAQPPVGLFSSFTMDQVFPGSKKIRLVSEHKHNVFFFALFMYKLNTNYYYEEGFIDKAYNNIHFIPEHRIIEGLSWDEFDDKLEDFIDVDVGKLFIENGSNIDVVEQQLSDLIGTKIVLDRNYLEHQYCPKNTEILEHIFGKNYLNNKPEKNVQLLIDYGRERAKANF